MQGPEAVEIAVCATLTTHLNAELATVWATYAAYDAGQTKPPSPPLVYPKLILPGQLDLVGELPAITVAWLDAQVRADHGAEWDIVEHHVDVTVGCTSSHKVTLDRMVKRYITAIWRCIQHHQQLDGSVAGLYGAAVADMGKSKQFKDDRNSLIQYGGVMLSVTVEESL